MERCQRIRWPDFLTDNKNSNAALVGAICKQYGQTPSQYLGILDSYVAYDIDRGIVLLMAHLENEAIEDMRKKEAQEAKERDRFSQ
jgi:hypothetical protein